MKEQRFEMKPYGVRYLCDCESEMIPYGSMLLSDPPKYPHKCSNKECNKIVNLSERFPTVRWEKA